MTAQSDTLPSTRSGLEQTTRAAMGMIEPSNAFLSSTPDQQHMPAASTSMVDQSDAAPESKNRTPVPSSRSTYQRIPMTSRDGTAQFNNLPSSLPIRRRPGQQQIPAVPRRLLPQANTLPSSRPLMIPTPNQQQIPGASRSMTAQSNTLPGIAPINPRSSQQQRVEDWVGMVGPQTLDAARTLIQLSGNPGFVCPFCGNRYMSLE